MLRIIISTIKLTAKIILIIILMLSAFFIILQTGYGKNNLIDTVNFFLNEKYAIRLEAEGLTGTMPYNIRIDRLALYDKSGAWLEMEKVAFQSSPLLLFKGRLLIKRLIVDSMDFYRLPQVPESDKPKANRPFLLPTAAYCIGLEHLNIRYLQLGEEILGRPASFVIEAAINEKEAGNGSRISIKVERTDGVAGSAFLEAELKGTGPFLNINAGIEEPEKGLIGSMIGINSPFFMTMEGTGHIKEWKGHLFIRADKLTEIDADIGLNILEDMLLDMEGTALIYPSLIANPFNEFFNPNTKFNIRSHMGDNKRLYLDHAAFKSGNALLDLNASLDIKHMILEGAFKVDLMDISPLGQSLHRELSGDLSIEGNFEGPFFSPSSNLTLAIRDFRSDEFQCNVFNAKALVEFLPPDGSLKKVLRVSGEGNILEPSIPALSDSPIEKDITWNLDMTGPDKGGNIGIKDLQINGTLLSAEISGAYNKGLNNGSFKTSLTVESMERLADVLKVGIPPGIGTNVRLNTEFSESSLNASLYGKLLISEDAGISISSITGPEIDYTGNIGFSHSKVLRFSNLKFYSDKAEILCSGSYDVPNREIHGFLGLETNNLEAFSHLLDRDIQGSAGIQGIIDGTIDMLNIKIQVRAENLIFYNTMLEHLSASLDLSGQALKNEGIVSFLIEQPGFTLKGGSSFKIDNKILSFKDISWEGPGFDLKGDLSADLNKDLVQGEIHANCKDLSVFKDLYGMEIFGAGDLYVKSTPVKGKNRIDFHVHANDISGPFGETDNVDINLGLSGELREPEIEVSVSVADFSRENIFLNSVNINAKGKLQDFDFTITGTGRSGYDILMESSGNLSLSDMEQSLAVNRFHGEYGIIPVNLTRPFKATRSAGTLEIEPLELSLSSGKMDLSGKISEDYINFQINFFQMPVSFLQLAGFTELEGNADGNIILSGTPNQPQAKMQFIIDDLKLWDPQNANLLPFNVAALVSLHGNRLVSELSMDILNGTPFKLKMDIPIRISLSPFSLDFPDNEDINGRITGDIDLANTALLAGIYDQKIMGKLDIELDIKGTVKTPIITGKAGLENGSYENNNAGILINNINAHITSEAGRFVLKTISGTDGNEGKISGSGWFDFSPSKGFPYSLSLNLKKMSLIRSDTTSITASGKPNISGTLNERTLTGKLSIDKGEYRIPERLPAEITDLAVIEINVPEQYQSVGQINTSKKSPMKLDISVETDGQVYMTGRGLNSEWKGDVKIKGTTAEPSITGRLSILRGSYNFLGKRFDLTDGTIDLDGKYPMSPYIDITGEADTAEITAIINLMGDLKKPEISLSSDPSLPSDEILSHLLFGRDISQITPLQAIELGNALNTMMGKSRYDIMGSTKKILGVDQIDVKQSDESDEETVVSVGKYIRDDVYIEVEKGLGEGSGKASVTWELTPNITVDTEMGQDSSTDVGINWKWNY